MRRGFVIFALVLAACSPPQRPAGAPPAAVQDLGLRQHVGKYYADFIAVVGMERYTPDGLGLSDADRARFERDMAVQSPAPLAAGGGAEALVFQGCIAHACPDGVAVVAIDVATGDAFVAVRDPEGTEVLVPNDRIQALLEATSPSRRWDDPVVWQGPTPTAAP